MKSDKKCKCITVKPSNLHYKKHDFYSDEKCHWTHCYTYFQLFIEYHLFASIGVIPNLL